MIVCAKHPEEGEYPEHSSCLRCMIERVQSPAFIERLEQDASPVTFDRLNRAYEQVFAVRRDGDHFDWDTAEWLNPPDPAPPRQNAGRIHHSGAIDVDARDEPPEDRQLPPG